MLKYIFHVCQELYSTVWSFSQNILKKYLEEIEVEIIKNKFYFLLSV